MMDGRCAIGRRRNLLPPRLQLAVVERGAFQFGGPPEDPGAVCQESDAPHLLPQRVMQRCGGFVAPLELPRKRIEQQPRILPPHESGQPPRDQLRGAAHQCSVPGFARESGSVAVHLPA
ncbi:MAG: hypothetical protein NZM07_12310, partial [Elioraea sp.]|nr:hypothetical protein [Elioraea sp.]